MPDRIQLYDFGKLSSVYSPEKSKIVYSDSDERLSKLENKIDAISHDVYLLRKQLRELRTSNECGRSKRKSQDISFR